MHVVDIVEEHAVGLVVICIRLLVETALPEVFMQHVDGLDLWVPLQLRVVWDEETELAIVDALVCLEVFWAELTVEGLDPWNEAGSFTESMLVFVELKNEVCVQIHDRAIE